MPKFTKTPDDSSFPSTRPFIYILDATNCRRPFTMPLPFAPPLHLQSSTSVQALISGWLFSLFFPLGSHHSYYASYTATGCMFKLSLMMSSAKHSSPVAAELHHSYFPEPSPHSSFSVTLHFLTLFLLTNQPPSSFVTLQAYQYSVHPWKPVSKFCKCVFYGGFYNSVLLVYPGLLLKLGNVPTYC